jgi:nucleotide-binding universal stress UspA family protein
MIKTIVVGYDGSAPAKHALERAAEFAGQFGARLVVTSVAETVAVPSDALVPGDAIGLAAPAVLPLPDREEASRELREARALLEGRSLEVDYVSTVGDAADGIIEAAEQHAADLVVVGTRSPASSTVSSAATSARPCHAAGIATC